VKKFTTMLNFLFDFDTNMDSKMYDEYNKRIPSPKFLFNLKEITKKMLATTVVPIQYSLK